MDDETMRAWAYLSRVSEPPCSGLAALVSQVGPVEAAERIARAAVDPDLADGTAARREIDRAVADLDILRRRGGRLITPDDDEWPTLGFAAFSGSALRDKSRSGPPTVLWAIGPARLEDVAIALPLSSGLALRRRTATTSRPISPRGSPNTTSLWCREVPTGSTVRRTGQRWPPTV